MVSKMINTGINTDSFITGYSRTGKRTVRHLRIEDHASFMKIYTMGDFIGKGTFGTVFEVRDTKDNKTWASKMIEKKTVPSAHIKVLEREINILKVLNHPHIIILREVLESSSKIYLIMEKCFTDLLKLAKGTTCIFDEANVRRVIYDLTSAVTYLHKNDIVHRDVKLENILVTDNPHNSQDHLFIKLTDFGLSIVKSGYGITNMSMLHERCGTLQYMSPEILSSKSYSQQCDVWSIGIITFFLLASTMPFEAKTENELIEKICTDEPHLHSHNFSPELRDLLRRILNKDPAARITAAEMMNHSWLRGEKLIENTQSHNVIDMMRLCKDDMRITVEDDDDSAFGGQARSRAAIAVKNVTFDKNNKRNTSRSHRNAEEQATSDAVPNQKHESDERRRSAMGNKRPPSTRHRNSQY